MGALDAATHHPLEVQLAQLKANNYNWILGCELFHKWKEKIMSYLTSCPSLTMQGTSF